MNQRSRPKFIPHADCLNQPVIAARECAAGGALLSFCYIFVKTCVNLFYNQVHRISASYFIPSGSNMKNVFGHAEFG